MAQSINPSVRCSFTNTNKKYEYVEHVKVCHTLQDSISSNPKILREIVKRAIDHPTFHEMDSCIN